MRGWNTSNWACQHFQRKYHPVPTSPAEVRRGIFVGILRCGSQHRPDILCSSILLFRDSSSASRILKWSTSNSAC